MYARETHPNRVFTRREAPQPPRKRARKSRNDDAGPSVTRSAAKRKGKGRQAAGSLSGLMSMPLDVFFQVRLTFQYVYYIRSSQLPVRLLHTSILSTCLISLARPNRCALSCLPKVPGRRGSLLLPLWTASRCVQQTSASRCMRRFCLISTVL